MINHRRQSSNSKAVSRGVVEYNKYTHIDHVVFGVVRVRTANVNSAPVADGLDNTDVVPAIKILK